jgi:uncharacterized protein YhaN
MRFRALHIENFGIHRERGWDLAPGVQVVYGPNETGKSTLLSLLRHLLFGYPHQSPYLKCSDESQPLAARVAFELGDGRRGGLRRQKGRPDQVVGELAGESTPFDQEGLTRLLGGASAALYDNMFAFSSDELKAGAESLKAASLEEALFGGGLGGLVRYRRIEEELARRMAERFNPNVRAKNQPINRLLAEIKTAREQFQRGQCRPQAYDDLEQAYRQHAETVERLATELETHRREQLQCRQWLEALPQFNQLIAAREERARVTPPESLTAAAAGRFRQLQSARLPLLAGIAQLDVALRSRTPLPPLSAAESQRLQLAGEIGRLQRELSEMTKLRDELPQERRELERRQSDLAAVRAEWSGQAPPEITVAQRVLLRTLAEELAPLRKRDTQLKTQREGLDQRLARPRKKFEKLGPAESVEDWEDLAATARTWRDDCVTLATVGDELATAQREEAQLFQTVVGVIPFNAANPPGQLPLRATIEEYRARWQPAVEELQRAGERLAELRAELQQAQQSLAEWDRTGRGDSRTRVIALRQHRDDGWSLVRRSVEGPGDDALAAAIDRWTNGQPVRLFDLYESAVAAADLQGDEALVHAEWHAVRNQRENQVSRLEERSVDLRERLEQAEQTCRALEADWRQEWSRSDLSPRKPAEMLEWLDGYEEWQQARRQCADRADRQATLQSRTAVDESRLRARLPQLPAAPDAALRQIETRRDVVRKQEDDRTRLLSEIDDVQSEIEVLKEREREAAQELGDWRHRLQRLLREAQLPEDWSIEVVTRVLESIDAGRQTQAECDRLARDVREHAESLEQFAHRVGDLLKLLSDGPAAGDPVTAAERLVEELAAARQRQEELSQAETESARDRALHAHQAEALAGIDRALADLGAECAAADVDQLTRFVEQFDAASTLDDQLRSLDRDLRTRLGAAWPDIAVALSQVTASGLHERLQRIEADIAALEESQQAAIEQRGLAENRLRSLADETSGLELGAKLQSLRAALEQEAHQWAPLALTRAVMQRARERFEREHQPRILLEVSRLMDRITAGEHPGIERALDASSTLLVKGRDESTRLRPDQLSTGTQAQLYLAIRLAFAADYCAHNEPLPIVMDDVLVTFDEDRARRTLEVLAEFATHTQVMLLTCHRRTVQLWQGLQPDTPVIELAVAGAEAAASDAVAPTKKPRTSKRSRRSTTDDQVLFPTT